MNSLTSILRRAPVLCCALLTAFGVSLVAPSLAYADVVQCGDATCTAPFTVSIGGRQAGTGQFEYDAETGEILFDPTDATWTANGSTISLNNLEGNVDPIFGFAISASNSAAMGNTFALAFTVPIAIEGSIQARAETSYSLTSTSSAGAEIRPLGTDNKVVRSWDMQSGVGGQSVNKGVDVGDTFGFLGIGTQSSATYSAAHMFDLGSGFDVMVISIDFFLTASSFVGISGFVEQLVVPLPAALPLLLTGLIGFGVVARRRRSAASPRWTTGRGRLEGVADIARP